MKQDQKQTSHLIKKVKLANHRARGLGQYPTWITTSTISGLGIEDTWAHVVFTWKKSSIDASDGAIFVDGESVQTDFSAPYGGYSGAFTIGYAAYPLYFARKVDAAWPSNYFDGMLDEVRIWKRALSASEVYSSYASKRKVLPIAGPVIFTSAFRVPASTPSTIKIYIWPSDPTVTIDDATTNPKMPFTPKTRSGDYTPGTKGDWYIEVQVWQDSGSPC